MIRIQIRGKRWIRIRIEVKIRSFRGSKWSLGGPRAVDTQMEPWKFYSLVVAGSHHFDEKQDPDLDPHMLDPDPY